MTKKIRLTPKLTEEILTEVVGQDTLPLIEFLKNRKNISEFIIAEKTKIEIHQVRNILYRMHSQNLATYRRKKDSKKGYYISYWTYNAKRIKDLVLALHQQKLDRLMVRLEREEKNKGCFFLCANACARLDFEQSSELSFKCPECGSLLNQQDNSRTIDHIKQQIKELEALM
ncbi:hypothetical protein HYY69_05665 [Candidatus Woesearchaeota archaeon]|nr:hypothetical protein [Candidatus Woesearchaeota archaeon]